MIPQQYKLNVMEPAVSRSYASVLFLATIHLVSILAWTWSPQAHACQLPLHHLGMLENRHLHEAQCKTPGISQILLIGKFMNHDHLSANKCGGVSRDTATPKNRKRFSATA